VIEERLSLPTGRGLAVATGGIGADLAGLGRLDEAAVSFARAIDILEQGYGPDYTSLIDPLLGLGRVQLRQGKTDAATATLRRAAKLAEAHPDPYFKGAAHFALAEATKDRKLAQQALGELESANAVNEVKNVRRWLGD
jgi:tetratricopeptide (TPR) repeat protein